MPSITQMKLDLEVAIARRDRELQSALDEADANVNVCFESAMECARTGGRIDGWLCIAEAHRVKRDRILASIHAKHH